MPATNAAMKPEPPSAVGDPVGERRAGGRDHLPPGVRDQVAAAGVARRSPPSAAPADDAAERRRSRSPRAAACAALRPSRDLRFDVGGRDGANSSGTQIPSLSPLSTLSPWRIRPGTRGSVTTAWPSAASVGARTTARIDGLLDAQLAEDQRTAASAPSAMVSGRPIPSRRTGTPTVAAQRARSIRDASENSTSASVASASVAHRRARAREVDPVEHLGPDEQPDRDEHHRRRDRRAGQPPRDGGDGEQRERDDDEGPLHLGQHDGAAPALLGVSGSGRSQMSPAGASPSENGGRHP